MPLPGPSTRLAAAIAGIALLLATRLQADSREDPLAERTGGDTTVWASGQQAFSFPAANLTGAERTRFVVGNSFFKRNWVEAPASTTARDGLGPQFIARSCGACHTLDGRGAPPDFRQGLNHDAPVALLLRLSSPRGGPEPTYGDQFNNAAVTGVKPEGRVVMRWTPVRGRFNDGTPYTLQRPHYRFADLAHGPMVPGTQVSPRIAPQLIGAGLLEAIPDTEILRNAAAQAAAPGPIKGRPNRVWDTFGQREMLGRFGWKANAATLAHQTAAAFVGDIGITSDRFPDETCTAAQRDCLAAPRGAHGQGTEIDARTLADVVFYQAVLAPPARRAPADPQVLRGQWLFAQAQCAQCHRPSYVTGPSPFPALASPALQGQTIHPYTDLLLHDMGPGLADGRPDHGANGRQWKTPPLWGIGLIRQVNGHQRLLHDGRADGVLEAVLWHGGEAEASRRAVLGFSADDRAALVKFVESL